MGLYIPIALHYILKMMLTGKHWKRMISSTWMGNLYMVVLMENAKGMSNFILSLGDSIGWKYL